MRRQYLVIAVGHLFCALAFAFFAGIYLDRGEEVKAAGNALAGLTLGLSALMLTRLVKP